jgi:cell division FtsZ-interacting protein ZapD
MTIDERSRHRLYLRLEEVLGQEEATVLMEHLPPVGWAEVATKRDLDTLGTTLRLEFRADLHEALHQQTRRFVKWMIALQSATLVTLGGLMTALKLF